MKLLILLLLIFNLHANQNIKTVDDRSYAFKNITSSWGTNWNKRTIEFDELLSGGPPRDGIPPIDKPKFIDATSAKSWINDNEPIILVKIGLHVKAYPIQILIWHEIVNDVLSDRSILVSFCPLCNATIVFDRVHKGKLYDFGTSGLLRNSDLVMYDRQSETLWQQFTGRAIVGNKAGEKLTMLPSSMISFKEYYTAYPKGLVLSKETGFNRQYGNNPYVGYDNINSSPFLYDNPVDKRLKPMRRVVSLVGKNGAIAYPYNILKKKKVINDTFDGEQIVLFHKSGTVSALDSRKITNSQDVGSTAVFSAVLDGKVLSFIYDKTKGIIDEQTESSWTILGKAIGGKLKGKELKQKVHADHFWFSFAAFNPNTEVYK
jgi:hypothetical protein